MGRIRTVAGLEEFTCTCKDLKFRQGEGVALMNDYLWVNIAVYRKKAQKKGF